MAKTFYVQNKKTREFLNQKGSWSKTVSSYRVAEFDDEPSARAAFPQDAECQVIFGNKREEQKPAVKGASPLLKAVAAPESASPSKLVAPKFFLRKGQLFLDISDKFSVRHVSEAAARFDTRDQALDKAEALGVNLDDIVVASMLVRLSAVASG